MPPAAVTLFTERLLVRLVEYGDLPDLLEVHRDDAVTRFLPYGRWDSLADAEAWYARMMARQQQGSALQFVIAEREGGRVIGTALLFQFDEINRLAELGYVLGRRHWGGGLMHEALVALLDHAFGTMALRRIEAEIDPRNAASDHVLRRLGFRAEGLLRQRRQGRGELRDARLFGLLRDDWRVPPQPAERPLQILVAGPYRSGTGDDPALIAKNVEAMTATALQLFRAGHLPMLGEWLALPLIREAGSTRIGDAAFDEVFHPVARRLVAACDGCLRIGGASAGADEMVALARAHGRVVYFALDEIPPAALAVPPA